MKYLKSDKITVRFSSLEVWAPWSGANWRQLHAHDVSAWSLSGVAACFWFSERGPIEYEFLMKLSKIDAPRHKSR
jgi:hypothetical protein